MFFSSSLLKLHNNYKAFWNNYLSYLSIILLIHCNMFMIVNHVSRALSKLPSNECIWFSIKKKVFKVQNYKKEEKEFGTYKKLNLQNDSRLNYKEWYNKVLSLMKAFFNWDMLYMFTLCHFHRMHMCMFPQLKTTLVGPEYFIFLNVILFRVSSMILQTLDPFIRRIFFSILCTSFLDRMQ